VAQVRERCPDVVVCVSTSGRLFKTFEERSEVLELSGELGPEMASLTLGSLNFPKQASVNDPDMIRSLAEKMKEHAIKPELEVFHVATVVQELPPGSTWAAAGIGRFQLYVNSLAVAAGGNVRVGLEDNLWLDASKTRPATNAALVERVAGIAASVEREIASPAQARELIGLPARRPKVLATEPLQPAS